MAQKPDKRLFTGTTFPALPPYATAGLVGLGLAAVFALLFGVSVGQFFVALLICIAFTFGMLKLTGKA